MALQTWLLVTTWVLPTGLRSISKPRRWHHGGSVGSLHGMMSSHPPKKHVKSPGHWRLRGMEFFPILGLARIDGRFGWGNFSVEAKLPFQNAIWDWQPCCLGFQALIAGHKEGSLTATSCHSLVVLSLAAADGWCWGAREIFCFTW